MFEDLEYRHHAKISRNAWYLKLWCWAWMTEPENADFCKLFWGYVFMGPNLFVRVVAFPFWAIWQGIKALARLIPKKEEEERVMTHEEYMAMVKKEREELEARTQKRRRRKKEREAAIAAFFGRIGMAADRLVGAFQWAWPVIRWFFYALTVALALALAGALVWGLTMLVPLVINNILGVLTVLAFVAGFAAAMALGITIFGGTAYFFTETDRGLETRRAVRSGGGSFFHAMYVGISAVKSRTCPKVELIEENGGK